MADNAGPSNQEYQIIDHFKEVCDVDTTVAIQFLEKSSWNLVQAIHEYFHNNETEELNINRLGIRRRNTELSDPSNSNTNNAVATTSTQNFGNGVVSWFRWFKYYFINVPFKIFYSAISYAFTFAYLLFGNQRLLSSDPRVDVRDFIQEIVAKQEGHDIVTFVNGSYDDAVRRAKRNIQCLIVYLHLPSQECTKFLKSHILTERFRNLLRQNDSLLWGVSSQSQEGKKVSSSLRIITFPSLALITCCPNGKMACILRLSGNEIFSPNGIFIELQAAFDENKPYLKPLLNEKNMREKNRQLLREQEAEYAQSLMLDKAKREEKLRLEAIENERKQKENQVQADFQRKKENLIRMREKINSELPKQPTLTSSDPDSICVRIKFPDGHTLNWIFNCSASLEELFNVVFAHKKCPNDFTLVMGYPPQILNCAPKWYREYSANIDDDLEILTFKESGFHKNAVVLVRDNDA